MTIVGPEGSLSCLSNKEGLIFLLGAIPKSTTEREITKLPMRQRLAGHHFGRASQLPLKASSGDNGRLEQRLPLDTLDTIALKGALITARQDLLQETHLGTTPLRTQLVGLTSPLRSLITKTYDFLNRV